MSTLTLSKHQLIDAEINVMRKLFLHHPVKGFRHTKNSCYLDRVLIMVSNKLDRKQIKT